MRIETQQLVATDTSVDLEDALAARVKDPLWFLARQWQMGELAAENGGHPTDMAIEWREFALTHIVRRDKVAELVETDAPLEHAVEREGEPGDLEGDSPAWRAQALEYRFTAHTAAHELSARGYDGRSLDWYHFDLTAAKPDAVSRHKGTTRVIPTSIHVRGAPHPRWWRLEEDPATLEGPLDPEPNALSLLLPEFFFVDANNWYVAPLAQTAGSIQEITRLTITDSFGVEAMIEPAAARWSDAEWQVFSIGGDPDSLKGLGGRLLFVPNVAIDILHNDDLEEVRFLRDEDNNLVWACEKRYRGADGTSVVNGDSARLPIDEVAVAAEEEALQRFRFRLDAPAHWIPYLPRQVVANGGVGEMYLRRGRSIESATREEPQHRTRVVKESWKLDEHEVPRTGIRVRRIARFARGSDGEPYFWVGRQKEAAERLPMPPAGHDFLDPP